MRPEFQTRMENLVEGEWQWHDYATHTTTVSEQVQYLVEGCVATIAEHESEISPAKLEASHVPGPMKYVGIRQELDRLLVEGLLRVIDDRNQDPAYMASMDPDARRNLENFSSGLLKDS